MEDIPLGAVAPCHRCKSESYHYEQERLGRVVLVCTGCGNEYTSRHARPGRTEYVPTRPKARNQRKRKEHAIDRLTDEEIGAEVRRQYEVLARSKGLGYISASFLIDNLEVTIKYAYGDDI